MQAIFSACLPTTVRQEKRFELFNTKTMKMKNMILCPLHFAVAIVGFYLCTVIMAQIKVQNAPESFNFDFLPAFNGCLSNDEYTVLFFFDESAICNKMRYNLEQTMITGNQHIRYFGVDVNNRQHPDFHLPIPASVPTIMILKGEKEITRVMGFVSQGNIKKIYTKKIINT
jgi:hypothetical protein